MRKIISLFLTAALLAPSFPAPAFARVAAKTAAAPVSAPAALGLPAALASGFAAISPSLTAPSLATSLPSFGAATLPQLRPAAPAATAPAAQPQAAVLQRQTPVTAPTAAVPAAAKERRPLAVRRALERAAREIAPAAKKEGGAAAARALSNRFFDAGGNAADAGDGVPVIAAPAARRSAGLKAPQAARRFASSAAVPAAAAVAANPSLPARIGEWIVQLPGVETVISVFMLMPAWAQTGFWVGAGFSAAAIAPRIVRPVAKAVFRQLEWNKLREDWLTNVITYAAWFGAATYAMGMVGGWQSLAVNSSVFALTTTFAVKDVAANVADGFFLYQNRTLEIGQPFEALGVKGVLDGANPRFVIVDTSDQTDYGFDRVLIPNEKLADAGIGGVAGENDANARKFGAAAALSLASVGAAWLALGPLGQSLVVAAAAFWLGKSLNAWVKSQETKAEGFKGSDLEKYRKFRTRSRILWWVRNGVYLSGMGLILHLFGVPVGGMITGLSIFSAAAGFYMKSVSENLVGGLMIAAYLPFEEGDFIEVGKYKGVVAGMTQSELRLWTDPEWKDGARGFIDVPLTYVMKEVIKIRTVAGNS